MTINNPSRLVMALDHPFVDRIELRAHSVGMRVFVRQPCLFRLCLLVIVTAKEFTEYAHDGVLSVLACLPAAPPPGKRLLLIVIRGARPTSFDGFGDDITIGILIYIRGVLLCDTFDGRPFHIARLKTLLIRLFPDSCTQI